MEAGVVSIVFLAASAVQAPLPPSSPPEQEIIVTGERVERSLRETPSSVAVFTDDAIEALAGTDVVDQLLGSVPNVQLGSGGQGPTIRGADSTGVLQDLPAFLGATRPRVTLQVDGRAVGYHEFVFGAAPLWDVRQVEIFRSPQTTTQGRNSIAGAIFVRSNDPAHDWQGKARAIVSARDTRQWSLAVTGPIVADQVAFRAAADLRRGRTASRIDGPIVGADPNRTEYGLVRFKLLAEPAAIPGLRMIATYVHSESQSPSIEGVVRPFRQRRDPRAGYGVYDVNVDSLTGRIDVDLAPALELATTVSRGDALSRRYAPAGLGQARMHLRDFSLESVLNWTPSYALRMVGGIYHLRSRLDQAIDLSAVVGLGEFDDKQGSLGLFGEATVRPVGRLAVTAGLRYQRDSQDRRGQLGPPAFAEPVNFNESFGAWLPKVSLAWDFTETVTAGVLVQRAFNPGGTTLNFETGKQDRFDAETLWSYEAFARAALAGGRGRLSANLFYNDYRDAQRAHARPFVGPGGAIAVWAEINNVPTARSYGLEAELSWRLTPRLDARGGLGLLNTRITRTSDPGDPIDGKRFQRSPGFTASAAIDWRPVEHLRLSGQVRRHGAYFSNDANTPALRIPAATLVDARAALDVGPMTLFAFARNLLDDFQMTALLSTMRGTAADPRTVGLGVEARF